MEVGERYQVLLAALVGNIIVFDGKEEKEKEKLIVIAEAEA